MSSETHQYRHYRHDLHDYARSSQGAPFTWSRHHRRVDQRLIRGNFGLERAEAVQRRARRRRIQAFTALSALLALALVAAGIALAQRQTAVRQQRIATARQLITQAEATRATDPRTALRLGIAAQRIENSPETQTSLVNTLTTTHFAGALTGHKARVSGVAYTPDASTLATASSDNTVRLWNVRDLARLRPFGPPLHHKGEVFAVAFAPDGRTLATGNYEDGTSIWSVADRDRPRLLTRLAANTESVFAVAFAPDGRTLASGVGDNIGDNSVTLWDVADRRHPRLLTRLTGHTRADPGHRRRRWPSGSVGPRYAERPPQSPSPARLYSCRTRP